MSARIGTLFLLLLFTIQQGAGFPENDIPPELLVEYRLAELNNASPVSLDYNDHVAEFIDIFTVERRESLSRIVGLCELYMPLIEEIFDRHNLPLEIKYLAIVESALDPFAVSPSGAVGLWQFLLHTARMFDLRVDSYIDERRDPFRSTEAAARYMNYLYQIFGDWHLVMAAYNSGPGVVRNAIERSGGKRNYWEIRDLLPEQSGRFVPAFIAINYLMNYYEDYRITPVTPLYSFEQVDTVHITRPLSLMQVSRVLDVPIETLRLLNPVYRLDYIPSGRDENVLVLPSEKVPVFFRDQERVYAYRITGLHDKDSSTADPAGLVRMVHVVKGGEFIHKIAMIYGTISDNIIRWNHLSDDTIYAGQELIIWVDPGFIINTDDGGLIRSFPESSGTSEVPAIPAKGFYRY